MADNLVLRKPSGLRRVSFDELPAIHSQSLAEMSAPIPIPHKAAVELAPDPTSPPDVKVLSAASSTTSSSPPEASKTPQLGFVSSGSPRLSRNPSFSGSSSYQEDWEAIPPLDRLTVFDLLDNFALPQQLEKLQNTISAQTEKVRRQRDALRSRGSYAKERVIEEWRRRIPPADEQLEKYRKRMRSSVEKLGQRWNDTKAVTLREKFSFIGGVLNIFISGYLIGGYPQYFHVWYTAQLLYFMPIRFYTYHKRGYHYFLADLCYFVNFLCMLSIWMFPSSKRLFISTYCLAFGNNAVAIAMWRNSMVFHSLDKITSLFIHIMPCVALHCLVHLLPPGLQEDRFPAIWNIRNSPPGSSSHYTLFDMTLWATIPYAIWQLTYHFMISVRRREKIAAGRPTSFTWLRRSYSKVWIGKFVNSLPEYLQEPAFMMIQYCYALLTMLPCPIWFWYRIPSAAFLAAVFCWSIYNGATYYIDIFGKRFQAELEAMKLEVQKWQNNSEGATSPLIMPKVDGGVELNKAMEAADIAHGEKAGWAAASNYGHGHSHSTSVDKIPMLSEDGFVGSTGLDGGAMGVARERKLGELST